MNWYIQVLTNLMDFSGRARRKEYWMFTLFNIIFMIAAGIIDMIVFGDYGFVYAVYSLLLLVPSIAVCFRRIHDIGKSAWWLLIGLVPVLGSLLLLYWFIKDGDYGENQWGKSPKYDGAVI